MQEHKINPEKITKPIQLLAAWLIGLLLLVSVLLTASGTIREPSWIPAFLGISAVAIIPFFLVLIFLLQTKYRPEMQEDSYYSKYLNKDTMKVEKIENFTVRESETLEQQVEKISEINKIQFHQIEEIVEEKNPEKNKEKKIKAIISSSEQRLKELKKIAKLSTFTLWLNTKIHKYTDIFPIIQKIGFVTIRQFGNKPVPAYFTVSFGSKVSLAVAKNIILELIPYGAGIVQGVEEDEFEWNCNNIYIGSYATNINSIIINGFFINKLNESNEEILFIDFLKTIINDF